MEELIRVIYLGAASPDLPEHDTVKFLNEVRKANRQNDISGMMLYVGGCLLMLFETIEPLEAGRLLGERLLFDASSRVACIDPNNAKTLLSIIGRRRWQSDRSGMFRAIRRAAKLPATS
jgi:hypothetical protein